MPCVLVRRDRAALSKPKNLQPLEGDIDVLVLLFDLVVADHRDKIVEFVLLDELGELASLIRASLSSRSCSGTEGSGESADLMLNAVVPIPDPRDGS